VLQGAELLEQPAMLEDPPEVGRPDELYFERVEDYEKTKLRGIFTQRMKIVEPRWMQVFGDSGLQADFGYAVESDGGAFNQALIKRWLEDIAAGIQQPVFRTICSLGYQRGSVHQSFTFLGTLFQIFWQF